MHIILCLVCEHSKQFCIPHHFHVFGLLPHQALGRFISMVKPNFSQNSKFCNNLFKFSESNISEIFQDYDSSEFFQGLYGM